MRIIYIDVLVITNFIVSLFLLFVVKKISHSASSNLRMIFSGFVLSSASFLILFDNNSFTDEFVTATRKTDYLSLRTFNLLQNKKS